MSKHLLFFIHGMGTHTSSWHESAVQMLKTAFGEYPRLESRLAFDELIEPVPIIYDDQFEKLRTRWREDLSGLKATLLSDLDDGDQAQSSRVSKRIDEIGQWSGSSGDTFYATHAMDILLYRFFKTVRMNINVQVATQIVNKIKGNGSLPDWSVVAHSLGTAVAHNTINAMYGTTFAESKRLRVEDTRPRVLCMVSNVSRLLQLPSVPVYTSRVQPGSVLGGRCCKYYLNARHRLDPFTVPKPFEPDAWPTVPIYNSDRYQHLRPSHFIIDKLEEIHALDHYLRNPRVHVPLLRALFGNDFIPDDDFDAAKQRFDSEALNASTEMIREKLEKLQQSLGPDWQALIKILKKWRA